MGSILSGIFGGGSTPGQQQQAGAIKASQADLQRYRQEAMQARLNALNAMTGAYQGTNNALETLWGNPNQQGPQMGARSQPRRMMGHDMPQDYGSGGFQGDFAARPDEPMRPPMDAKNQIISTALDPINLFGLR